jgi:hypothetical protein
MADMAACGPWTFLLLGKGRTIKLSNFLYIKISELQIHLNY